jgi:hypothetical protein
MTDRDRLRLLVELRPAFDGHAGIPQETRLLFRGLRQLPGLEVDGLLQSSQFLLARGLPTDARTLANWPQHRRINRLSRVVVSAEPGRKPTRYELLQGRLRVLSTLVGGTQSLSAFEPTWHRDFLWRALFAKTLPPQDFDAVTGGGYRILRLPRGMANQWALGLRPWLRRPVYPRVDTRGYDVLVVETPFPGRPTGSTRLVVRYHDAIPILMPHSISDRSTHQASHYHALRRNVDDGAWFACVSEAVRRDLLELFPQLESRSETIHNMVSHHYYAGAPEPQRVPDILRTRRARHEGLQPPKDGESALAPAAGPRRRDQRAAPAAYLLMVSTLEPRKNHLGLLAAWERLRHAGHPNLQLVFVGSRGWDADPIIAKCRPWVARGALHLLEDVPATELRLLYQHAAITVCPSFGEGFDFAGVEAMQCGGIVAASDLPVHREVYDDAAVYFNPYDAEAIAAAVAALLSDDAAPHRAQRVERGASVSRRYRPEVLLPRWQAFLQRATAAPLPRASIAAPPSRKPGTS